MCAKMLTKPQSECALVDEKDREKKNRKKKERKKERERLSKGNHH